MVKKQRVLGAQVAGLRHNHTVTSPDQRGNSHMPELPEVEITRRGIAPRITGQRVSGVVIRQRQLRWPITAHLESRMSGARIDAVERRAKYLLLRTSGGTALLHLGMSGSLSMVGQHTAAGKHDHVDFALENGSILRFNDPRRFGSLLWTDGDPLQHRLLAGLGPEPLGKKFDGGYLHQQCKGRRIAIKQHLMNGRVVVGVGNIYASEALFRAGIHPARAAGRIARQRLDRLVTAVTEVLNEAIRAGGTTLRNFSNEEGRPGYFARELRVYGRENQPCRNCGAAVKQIRQGQRATFFCTTCQT